MTMTTLRIRRPCRSRPWKLCIAMCAAIISAFVGATAAWSKEPFTVRASIETTRLMTGSRGESTVSSPDAQRFAFMLITGDIERDGVWADLRVGRLDTPAVAPPVSVARLFTRARGGGYRRHNGGYMLVWPRFNMPRWLDNDHLGLLWEDDRSIHQAVSVEVSTGKIRYLTQHPTDVLHFNVLPNGTLIYGASVPCTEHPSEQQQAEGYVVHAVDVFELIYGCGAFTRDQQALYVRSPDHAEARQIAMRHGDAASRSTPNFPEILFSPSGQQALFANTVSDIPADWAAYTHPHFRTMWRALESGGINSGYARQFQQLFVIDVATATARPLWAAPNESYGRLRAAWSPNGRTLMVGPTFLPTSSSDALGLTGEAVAAIDVRSGGYERLPLPAREATRIQSIRWRSSHDVEFALDSGCRVYRKAGARWSQIRSSTEPCDLSPRSALWSVALEQSLNDPPRLVATHKESGTRQLVLDPNDDLAARYSLGKVEWLERDTRGHQWRGRLYYPIDYQPGRRYPLVIQTHTVAGKSEFSLNSRGSTSPATGPSGSAYLAQPLANRGIFVLHGRAIDLDDTEPGLSRTQARIAAVEAVVDSLADAGMVDRSRVGVMGYSGSGWEVAYAIAHSRFPYAAALTDDNIDGSYWQAARSNWSYGLGEQLIGAPAFGEGLRNWLAESPAFNAHRITTPLLLTVTATAPPLAPWELFSRLRYLGKPVEFYVIPDLAHGTHGLQNPTQSIALQERALDWWCFWLKDEESPSPEKAQQYAGWRLLKDRQHKMSSPMTVE